MALHILIVSDSFKGSLSSCEAGRCIGEGLRRVFPDCTLAMAAVADGGEGTVEAVVSGTGGAYRHVTVSGPLGAPVDAVYGILPDGTAVIEMAAASGLPLISAEKRDPLRASTYGTGQLILDALDCGCRRFLIGIGGSATNDGGAGMAQALGGRFLDAAGEELPPGGGALGRLARIDCSALDPRIRESHFTVACDVTNPLWGANGASVVYAPQKGADEGQVVLLDAALRHYGEVLRETFGREIATLPGAGAAGGLGAGLMAFCAAELQSGIDIIFELLCLEEQIRQADMIFTGEGRADATSVSGKLLSGVGRLAKGYGKPVIAMAGSIGPGSERLLTAGIAAVMPIADRPLTLTECMEQAPDLLMAAAERAARLIKVGGQL